MKKRICILITILILIIVIIFLFKKFYKNQNLTFKDLLIFGMWQEDNVYIVNPNKTQDIQVNLYKTIEGGGKLYKRIAPGTKGEFVIIIKKDPDLKCKIIFTNITKKPKNMQFYLNGKTYNTLEEMQDEINEVLKEKDRVTINWEWKYNLNEQDDIEDTQDGENLKEYVFNMDAIVEDEEN